MGFQGCLFAVTDTDLYPCLVSEHSVSVMNVKSCKVAITASVGHAFAFLTLISPHTSCTYHTLRSNAALRIPAACHNCTVTTIQNSKRRPKSRSDLVRNRKT